MLEAQIFFTCVERLADFWWSSADICGVFERMTLEDAGMDGSNVSAGQLCPPEDQL